MINRREARDDVGFGDIIEYASNELEGKIEDIANQIHKVVGFSRATDKVDALEELLEKIRSVDIATGILFSAEKGFLFRHKIRMESKNTQEIQPRVTRHGEWEEVV